LLLLSKGTIFNFLSSNALQYLEQYVSSQARSPFNGLFVFIFLEQTGHCWWDMLIAMINKIIDRYKNFPYIKTTAPIPTAANTYISILLPSFVAVSPPSSSGSAYIHFLLLVGEVCVLALAS